MSKHTSAGRIPEFETKAIHALNQQASVLQHRLIAAIESNLQQRNANVSYDPGDRAIFEPMVDFTTINLHQNGLYSYVFHALLNVKEVVEAYEENHHVKMDKSDLFFSLAFTSLLNNSTINASAFWELCIHEESNATNNNYDAVAAVQSVLTRWSTLTTSVENGLMVNPLFASLKNTYNWIGGFSDTLKQLNDPAIFSYFSCGIRNRGGAGWLDTPGIEMPKMYAQELINALCILTEATLKLKPALTIFSQNTLGKIYNELELQNPAVAAIVGKSLRNHPKTGLFLTLPSGTQADFNANFPLLVNILKSVALSDDETKAHLVYGAYMLRNKVLHNYDNALVYYTNVALFKDAVAIAFASIAAVLAL